MVPFSIWQFNGELAIRNPLFVCRGVVMEYQDVMFDMGHFYTWIVVALTILPSALIVHARIAA